MPNHARNFNWQESPPHLDLLEKFSKPRDINRAQFDGPAPERRRLYWRGPVFWEFDGRTWRAGDVRVAETAQFEPQGQPIFYSVTIEPHERNWLFALDLPAKVPPGAGATGDFQLLTRVPVRSRMRYAASSFLDYRAIGGASRHELESARELPPACNPRAVALAQSWRREAGTDERILPRAIEHFRRANLQYTLAPPPLGRDSVDEFLFETKSGFCEHFSSAFAFMLRAAGVRARIVTGYQGRRDQPGRRLPDRAPVRRARLGRSVDRGERLAAGRHRWPVGVQVCARPGDDALVLTVSRVVEEAQPWAPLLPPLDSNLDSRSQSP